MAFLHGESQFEKPYVFIQWKGTDVCADAHCTCGNSIHVCGEMFFYYFPCKKCGKIWAVGSQVKLYEIADQETIDRVREDWAWKWKMER